MLLDDNYFMGLAIAEARNAAAAGEIPIGAVVVASGRVIGRGHNRTEALTDVTAHAEMLAISAAAQSLGGKYLSDCTLYVTVEPCTMCAGALGWSQIGRIVYGTADPRRGYSAVCREDASPFHPKTEISSGIRADECREMMQEFFRSKRNSK